MLVVRNANGIDDYSFEASPLAKLSCDGNPVQRNWGTMEELAVLLACQKDVLRRWPTRDRRRT